MNKQVILTVILSVINLTWFTYSIYLIFEYTLLKGLIHLIPIFLGLTIFLILKYVKHFELIRALKYANIVSIIPIGLLLILYNFFFRVVEQPLAGNMRMVDPLREKCTNICLNKTKEITNNTQACIENCINNLKK